jgi:predicted phage terminase large subunit-like protein
MSVDATFKDEKKNDYVAISVWGKIGVRLYLMDMINEHLNFADTVRKVVVTKAKYPKLSSIYIEDKANGSAIIQMLRDRISGVVSVTPDVSKEARVNAVSYLIEAGNVYLPKDKKITWEFIDQCSAFPNGKHDDMVDSMSMALAKLSRAKSYMREAKRVVDGLEDMFKPSKKRKSRRKAIGAGETIHVI